MKSSEADLKNAKQYRGRTKGLRCQVCTGCGLCPGVVREKGREGIQVLTEDGLEGKGFTLKNEFGLRLIAADVGTTTIAMELLREDGTVEDSFACLNPQAKYGADVLSRVQAAKDPAARNEMQSMVKSALTQGVERFLKCLRPEKGEKPLVVIAANTVMSYLLLGHDPEELGQAPFTATHLQGGEFELTVPCVVLPGFSAVVGSDLFAGAFACGMTERPEIQLLVDLGTNGEILLGNRDRILATATAAGPAFEGGPAKGTFGADLIKLVARLLEEGLLDETGLLAEPYFEGGVRIGNVTLTKEAIRSLQVAKAAIQAGIAVLMKAYGITGEEIDRVILGGGFGYFLNPADAVRIGLLPASLEKKAVSGGNTALAGAKRLGACLLAEGIYDSDESAEDAPEEGGPLQAFRRILKGRVEVLNLAQQESFSELYVAAMAFKPVP
ncbi:MAG: DUF4445 domain-containing protein [Lachnospiraceae bacterium]|nr:DUF4445 domain-containing protein [Lachnospiraceae bacterium]